MGTAIIISIDYTSIEVDSIEQYIRPDSIKVEITSGEFVDINTMVVAYERAKQLRVI